MLGMLIDKIYKNVPILSYFSKLVLLENKAFGQDFSFSEVDFLADS